MSSFNNNEVSSQDQAIYLRGRLPGENSNLPEEIVRQFWRASLFHSLLSDRYFLSLVGDYVSSRNIVKFSRAGFFIYLDEQLVGNKAVSTVLSRFAFAMELMQVVSLSLSETERFLDHGDIEHLIELRILSLESELVTFYHPSVHSFYSALYIAEVASPPTLLETIFARNGKKIAIAPNWYEVLGLLLQFPQHVGLCGWFARLLRRNPSVVVEDLLNSIALAGLEDILDENEKHKFFIFLYKLYKDKQIWLPDGAEHILSRFATSNEISVLNKDLLKGSGTETERIVEMGNAVGILDEILSVNPSLLDTPDDYWHELLIQFANDSSDNGVLQRRSLRALRKFNRSKDIDRLTPASKHPDKLVHEAFLIFCYEVAPNSKKTIQYLADGLLMGCEIYARYGFYEITTETGLRNFFSILGSKRCLCS
ncbi:hypothetical protein IPG36_00155 [bacterium]|nr:MAG: hypothetical protein IPG36_00155 [bacterium]